MDSDFEQMQYQHHFQDPQRQFQHQKQQMNCLTRFHSAPSAYFATFLDAVDSNFDPGGPAAGGGGSGDFSNARPLSPETENIFASFMSGLSGGGENEVSSSPKLRNIPENTAVQQAQFVPVVKQETEILQQQQQQQPPQQVVYHIQSKPPLLRPGSSASAVSSARESTFRGGAGAGAGASVGAGGASSIGGGNNINNITNSSGLTRHSSSPAGFFANILNIDNDYGVMKGMGNYGGGGGQINFSSQQASSTSGMMSQNLDIEAKVFNKSSNNDSNYMTGYFKTSWDDSVMSENFSNFDKSGGNEDMKTLSEINATESQIGDTQNRPPPLAYHLSLPKTPAMEKQYQETVPCVIRAKRGFATHPRSIAERVRRTKISEKLRKLQAVVPNMEEQTNTADMLDLAVEHIKDLQKQLKILTDDRAKCTCL